MRQLCRGRTRRVSSEASAARPRSRTAASGIATSAGELPATSGAARATARAARHRRNQRQMRTRAMAMRNLRCSHLSSNRRCFAQRRLSSRRRGAGATTRRRPSLSVTTRPLVLANEANSMPATRPELKPARHSSLTTRAKPSAGLRAATQLHQQQGLPPRDRAGWPGESVHHHHGFVSTVQ